MSRYYDDPYVKMCMDDSLEHHGIKGQKHGIRRFQYKDGSLTPAGRIRYGVGVVGRTVSKLKSKKKEKAVEKPVKQKASKKQQKTPEQIQAERKKKLNKAFVTETARKAFPDIDKMTNEELNRLTQRLESERKVREAALNEIKAEKAAYPDFFGKAQNFIKTAKDWSLTAVSAAETVENFYKAVGKVYKITTGNDLNKNDNNKNKNKNNKTSFTITTNEDGSTTITTDTNKK